MDDSWKKDVKRPDDGQDPLERAIDALCEAAADQGGWSRTLALIPDAAGALDSPIFLLSSAGQRTILGTPRRPSAEGQAA